MKKNVLGYLIKHIFTKIYKGAEVFVNIKAQLRMKLSSTDQTKILSNSIPVFTSQRNVSQKKWHDPYRQMNN